MNVIHDYRNLAYPLNILVHYWHINHNEYRVIDLYDTRCKFSNQFSIYNYLIRDINTDKLYLIQEQYISPRIKGIKIKFYEDIPEDIDITNISLFIFIGRDKNNYWLWFHKLFMCTWYYHFDVNYSLLFHNRYAIDDSDRVQYLLSLLNDYEKKMYNKINLFLEARQFLNGIEG